MGSVGNKYRVHEVAKDFGVPTKQITEILTKYAETPKNHMQVLEDRELSLIFEAGGQGGEPSRQAGDQARLPCAPDQGGGHPQGHGGESG